MKFVNLVKGVVVMENQKYILGVCIPTFNRREIVKECVQRLLSFDLPIEIVVSDNCSPDCTFEELSKIEDDRLRLFRHDHNVGASFNIHTTFMKATAAYSILISDEEDLVPSTLKFLIEYLQDRPDIGVYLGSGIVLNGKNKKYQDYEFKTSEEALYNLGFKTRYMSGIIMNTRLYHEHIGFVQEKDSAYYFDTYSFMFAEAKLMCYGRTVTSEKILYRQARKAKTSTTNNADEKVFYYEPEGRRTQLLCWLRAVNSLPLKKEFKQKLGIKLIFDAIELSFRCLVPEELMMIKDIATPIDYANFRSHVSLYTKNSIINEFIDCGINYMYQLKLLDSIPVSIKMSDCLSSECLEYYATRLSDCEKFGTPDKSVVDFNKLLSVIEELLCEKEKVEYIGVNFDSKSNSKSKIYYFDTQFVGRKKCEAIAAVSKLYKSNKIKHSDIRMDNLGNKEGVFNFCLSYMTMEEYNTFLDDIAYCVPTVKQNELADFFNHAPVFSDDTMAAAYYLGVTLDNGKWNCAKLYYRLRDVVNKDGKSIYVLDNSKYLNYLHCASSTKINAMLPCIEDLINDAGFNCWMTGVDVMDDNSEKAKIYLRADKTGYDIEKTLQILKTYVPVSARIMEIEKNMKLSIIAISCNDNHELGAQLYYVY